MKKLIILMVLLTLVFNAYSEENFKIKGSIESGYVSSNDLISNPVYIDMSLSIIFFKVIEVGKTMHTITYNLFDNYEYSSSTYAACLLGPLSFKIDYKTSGLIDTLTISSKLSFEL